MSDKEVYIFEVSRSSFNTSVLLNSNKIPVFVAFMGMWSEHCMHLEDLLAKFAREFAGQFIFAKVDIEEQVELRDEYEIKNVPTLKVFKSGDVVVTLEGKLEEKELRSLLRSQGVYRESEEVRERAREKHLAGETAEAISMLTQAIQQDGSNIRIILDMVQIFMDIGELEQASTLFERVPESERESDTGRALKGQITFKQFAANTDGMEKLNERVEVNVDDHDARFDLAICLVADYQYQQAMEQLFIIFEKAPDYKDGAAKEMIINITNMLAQSDPELAQRFRRKLGSTLT